MQRAVRLVEGSQERSESESAFEVLESWLGSMEELEKTYVGGGLGEWYLAGIGIQYRALSGEQGHYVVQNIDKEVSGVVEQLLTKVHLEVKLEEARAELEKSRSGLRSFLISQQMRQKLQYEVATIERDLSACEARLRDWKAKLSKVLEDAGLVEQGFFRISFDPKDAGLTDEKSSETVRVYMSPTVYLDAVMFQSMQSVDPIRFVEPIYLGTWYPTKSGDKMEGKFWWYRAEFWVSTGYSEEEARLLLWEKGRREQRKFERLAKAKAAAKEAREEAGRERIPEEVRLLVWERDGGRCVKCGSTEDLEFDHIIPVSKGGSSTEKNVQLLCAKCNREKGGRIA